MGRGRIPHVAEPPMFHGATYLFKHPLHTMTFLAGRTSNLFPQVLELQLPSVNLILWVEGKPQLQTWMGLIPQPAHSIFFSNGPRGMAVSILMSTSTSVGEAHVGRRYSPLTRAMRAMKETVNHYVLFSVELSNMKK